MVFTEFFVRWQLQHRIWKKNCYFWKKFVNVYRVWCTYVSRNIEWKFTMQCGIRYFEGLDPLDGNFWNCLVFFHDKTSDYQTVPRLKIPSLDNIFINPFFVETAHKTFFSPDVYSIYYLLFSKYLAVLKFKIRGHP